jgi:hypothetical protein
MPNNIKLDSLDRITTTSLLEDLKNTETKIKIKQFTIKEKFHLL